MKKIIYLLLAMFCVLNLFACKKNPTDEVIKVSCDELNKMACKKNPTDEVIKGFSETMRNFDLDGMEKFLGKNVEKFDRTYLDDDLVKKICKEGAGKIKYNVISQEIVNDKVVVKVKYSFIDWSKFYDEVSKEYWTMALGTSHEDADKVPSMGDGYEKLFKEKINKTNEFDTIEITFVCERKDDSWVITELNKDDILEIISGRYVSFINKMSDDFSRIFSESDF